MTEEGGVLCKCDRVKASFQGLFDIFFQRILRAVRAKRRVDMSVSFFHLCHSIKKLQNPAEIMQKVLISGQKMLVTWYHNNNENDRFSQYIY